MLDNYLKTTFRHLWKNKIFGLINIGGLTVGMIASILLLLWVQDELSFDRFHTKAPDIFRVINTSGNGEQAAYSAPAALAVFARRDIPEIKQAVRIIPDYREFLFTYKDKKFTETNCAYVDAAFFTLFNFPFVKGNARQPFLHLQSIVITESLAKKYFGNEEPTGKIIRADGKDNYMISGVIKDLPANSSIQYQVFFPMALRIKNYQPNIFWKSMETDWGNYGFDTYFLLQPGASIETVSQKLTQLYRENHPNESSSGIRFKLRNLAQTHLTAANGSTGALQMVRIFFIVAVIVLLIACINYVNLATARATQRAKEVGVRKIIGASKVQLFAQFLGESSIIIVISLLLALFFIQLLIPVYNELSGKQLLLNLSDPTLLSVVGITLAGTLLAAGIYPALLLSSFRPLEVMKGRFLAGRGNTSFRKILVVTQFTFSTALIISTLIISSQLQFIRNKELGYNKENVFMFAMRGDMGKHFESIKAELLREPGVHAVTASNNNLLHIGTTTGDTDWDGKMKDRLFVVSAMRVDEDFMDVFDMELIAGEAFTGSKADSTHFILNETAIREMGIENPVGKRFKLWQTEGIITGIMKDFHFSSIHNKIEPAVFYYRPEPNWRVYIKTNAEEAAKAIATTEKIWKEFNPAHPFEYTFLDESFDAMYKSDQRTGQLFNYFAGITILISCLGLFGLAAFTAEQRTKEIGIRKVLGASVSNITLLLSKDFLQLVVIAFVIASPIAWYTMHQWLQNFAYRIDISFWVFVLAGIMALLIALLTVSYQSIKAALSNPVKSLRSE